MVLSLDDMTALYGPELSGLVPQPGMGQQGAGDAGPGMGNPPMPHQNFFQKFIHGMPMMNVQHGFHGISPDQMQALKNSPLGQRFHTLFHPNHGNGPPGAPGGGPGGPVMQPGMAPGGQGAPQGVPSGETQTPYGVGGVGSVGAPGGGPNIDGSVGRMNPDLEDALINGGGRNFMARGMGGIIGAR